MAHRVTASALLIVALVVTGSARADTLDETVPLYTGDDLDRMFGPPPPPVTDPVDKTRGEDWIWVESYLDRQYARIDADRRYELSRRVVDVAEERTEREWVNRPLYGYASLGLGYPASTWWNGVYRSYATGGARACPKPQGQGHGQGRGHGRLKPRTP